MTESIRFHLDENVSTAVALSLRQRNINVTTCHEAGLLGATDQVQLDFAKGEQRVIFTQDADFLIMAAQDNEHCGIAYVRKGIRSIGQIIEALTLLHGVLTAAEMHGHVEFL